ncbi:hypothetical protein P872_23300 [Rhodonellum psychrophilum GCM71 = DSM 17998]|uniref:Uncharacterized protein n=2 Tax=Rhodonellum TaxID=336827 RepID=U5C4M0_9BACT|nr:hypothetical protein P872_23300 [Rhodonellum psychrophilum GCM71 = DSM 17998]SDY75639.1 hypothetical protein SAMN05444412_102485 [Rhodonellum ikkaensis]
MISRSLGIFFAPDPFFGPNSREINFNPSDALAFLMGLETERKSDCLEDNGF